MARKTAFTGYLPVCCRAAGRSGRLHPARSLSLRRLSSGKDSDRLRFSQPERGGQHRLHGDRCVNLGWQPHPVRQLRPLEGGPARHNLCGGSAGPDGGRHREFSQGGRCAVLRRDAECFSGKSGRYAPTPRRPRGP